MDLPPTVSVLRVLAVSVPTVTVIAVPFKLEDLGKCRSLGLFGFCTMGCWGSRVKLYTIAHNDAIEVVKSGIQVATPKYNIHLAIR